MPEESVNENEIQVNENSGINSNELVKATNDVVNNILNETDPANISQLKNLFKMHQFKKDIIRAAKLSDILDAVNDQILYNVTTFGPTMDDDTLAKYQNVLSKSLDMTNKELFDENNTSVLVQQNNISINNDNKTLSRESRERVLDVINSILSANNNEVIEAEANIIDDMEEDNL